MPKCTCTHCTCDINLKLTKFMRSSLLAQFLMIEWVIYCYSRSYLDDLFCTFPEWSLWYPSARGTLTWEINCDIYIFWKCCYGYKAIQWINDYENKNAKPVKKVNCESAKPKPRNLKGKSQANNTVIDKPVANVSSHISEEPPDSTNVWSSSNAFSDMQCK